MKNIKRLDALDAIRGVSALLVVLYHYTYRYYEIYGINNQLFFSIPLGYYGVQSFFIVSGFVIFMSIKKTNTIRDFVVHRFIRLYPTYWVSVIITFLVVLVFSLPSREVTILEFIANLTMIHTQFGIKSVDGVYWTLLFELKFYLLMIILFKFRFLNKIELISIFIMIYIFFMNFLSYEHSFIYKITRTVFILYYLNYFIAGIMYYKIYFKQENFLVYLTLFMSFVIGFLLNGRENLEAVFIIYFVFFLFSVKKIDFLAKKPLVFFGTISYALYLIHQNIGYVIFNYANKEDLSIYLSLLIALIVSVVLASIITFLVEKPIMIYLKNRYEIYLKHQNEV